jgi:hypothetical protein
MRDAARALDDVSDHLGEVLRRADQLLVEWSGFGAQVRAQVEREAAAIGTAVDGAVARAAGAGLDQAIADRLRALTGELERLEQRTRAVSHAIVQRREGDRRLLWIVVAGIVVANALLVALLLRKPVVVPAAEPVRIEAPAPASPAGDQGGGSAAGPTDGSAAASGATPPAPTAGSSAAAGANAGPGTSGGSGGSATAGAGSSAAGSAAATAPAKLGTTPPGGGKTAEPGATAKPVTPPSSLPAKGGLPRPHKKLP